MNTVYATWRKRFLDNEWNNPSGGVIVSPWAPPKDIRQFMFSDTSAASTVKSAWEDMLSEIIQAQFPGAMFGFCVESNEVGRFLALGGESLPGLVKIGFYTGAIDRVMAGGVQELSPFWGICRMYVPSCLVSHVDLNIVQCLDFLMNLVKNPSQWSEGSICQIHVMSMRLL